MNYTIYHAPEDTHLVGPLARFIELTEVDLVCVDSEPARYATAGLVMCGRDYDSQPWLKKALRSGNSVVAVLLADVDPGVKKERTVDLRSWPGRSADRTVLALTEWLKSEGKSSFPGMTTRPSTAARTQRSQNMVAFGALLLIVGLLFMMVQMTDHKSEALTPLSQLPPTASVSSTTARAPSPDSRQVNLSPGSTSGSSGSASGSSGSTSSTATDDHPSVLADSKAHTISAISKSARINGSKVPVTSRAELDQCYLERHADGGVPSRSCLISNAARLLDAQQAQELP